MKIKKITALTLCLGVCVSASAFTACKGGVKDDEGTLQLFTTFAGYGYDWLKKEGEEFLKQDWVKEKYPNLKVDVEYTTDSGKTASMMISGLDVNPYDVIFTTQTAAGNYDKVNKDGKSYFEDLSAVYNAKIPGEGDLTVAQKLDPSIYKDSQSRLLNGETALYGMTWVNSYVGLFVNETYVVESFKNTKYASKYIRQGDWSKAKLPVTTDELIQMCKDLKDLSKVGIVSSAPANYWSELFPIWWAQYEGTDSYTNFWKGENSEEEQTSEIFSQRGRKESLITIENLLGREHGFNHEQNTYASYTSAQTNFLLGNGALMANGDWLECEMSTVRFTDTIKILKTPVISALIAHDDLKNVTTDEELAFLVREADKADEDENYGYAQAKAAYSEEFGKQLTEKEYTRIFEARNTKARLGGHLAHIPSQSNNIEAAKDFLIFLATDKGIEIMMKNTGGFTPYIYDVQKKNPALYEEMSSIQKSHADLMKNGIMMIDEASYPLNYYGGVLPLQQHNALERLFMSQNEADRIGAVEIFNQICSYFQDNNGARFETALRSAGLR